MAKILGFNVNANMGLVMFLAGLGVLFYGIFSVVLNWDADVNAWLKLDYALLIVFNFVAILIGSYLVYASWKVRKHK